MKASSSRRRPSISRRYATAGSDGSQTQSARRVAFLQLETDGITAGAPLSFRTHSPPPVIVTSGRGFVDTYLKRREPLSEPK
jgi:hypothetical protein